MAALIEETATTLPPQARDRTFQATHAIVIDPAQYLQALDDRLAAEGKTRDVPESLRDYVEVEHVVRTYSLRSRFRPDASGPFGAISG